MKLSIQFRNLIEGVEDGFEDREEARKEIVQRHCRLFKLHEKHARGFCFFRYPVREVVINERMIQQSMEGSYSLEKRFRVCRHLF
jgi:hypothetical protein